MALIPLTPCIHKLTEGIWDAHRNDNNPTVLNLHIPPAPLGSGGVESHK